MYFFFSFDDCISEYELKESGLVYSSLFHYILRKKKIQILELFLEPQGFWRGGFSNEAFIK